MAGYREARAILTDLGLRRSLANVTMVTEALRRGVDVSRGVGKPPISFRHGGQEYRFSNGSTTLNSDVARMIGRYKDVQSRVLLNHGHNSPESVVFSPGDAQRAWQWAEPMGDLVVKPHNGTHGDHVHVGIETWEEFSQAFNTVAGERGLVLVEKFHTGTEHRFLLVDHKVVAVTRRRPASVQGDGVSTIAELVTEKNKSRGRLHKRIKTGVMERRHLQKQGLSFDTVPDDGVRIYLRGTSNIHTGGDAIDATEETTADEKAAVESAMSSIPGFRLVGLDVLLPRNPGDSGMTIIEMNPSPMISMHDFPWEGEKRNVSSHIMDAMFPATAKAS